MFRDEMSKPAFGQEGYLCRRCPFETRDRPEFMRHRQGHMLQDEAERRAGESPFKFTAEQLEQLKRGLFE